MREEKPQETGFRIVLYENANRIARAFAQRLPNVVEKVTNGEFTAEVSGGVASIFATKVGGKMAASQKIEVTPMMQALLLEEAASEERWLIDLRDRGGRLGDELLRFTGAGRMFGPGEPIEALPQFALVDGLAEELQAVRESQEASMQVRDPGHPGAFVWVARGAGPIAAIANFRSADENYDSYSSMPPFGVLGHYEGGPDPLTRIAPLLIWHLASNAYSTEPEQRARLEERDAAGSLAPVGDVLPRPSPDAEDRSPLADYQVLATVHTGLYGRVLKCRREGTVCAVKETTAPASTATLDALTRLPCPNLAAPARVWQSAGVIYEELPYVEGIPLSDLVRQGGTPVRGALLRKMQAQLAGVLTVLHAERIIHRDIHPENVFLVVRSGRDAAGGDYLSTWEAFSPFGGPGEVRPAVARRDPPRPEWAYDEFGIGEQRFLAAWVVGDCTFAISADDADQVEFRHGVYSPPELVIGAATTASDMFALGATLYYAMAAHEPPPVTAGQRTVTPAPPDSDAGFFISRYVTELMSGSPEERPPAHERLREGSLVSSYCGTLDLGNDMYIVMNTVGDRTALVQGRDAVRELTRTSW